ncbi:MAG: hypothetical protein OXJ90_14640 [Spirochaetaceae bacterium]|nr:hypothetical protein [Spirochaetaceae bacterium]
MLRDRHPRVPQAQGSQDNVFACGTNGEGVDDYMLEISVVADAPTH